MGGVCSRTRRTTADDISGNNGYDGGFAHANGHSNSEPVMGYQSRGLPSKISDSTPAAVDDGMNKQLREPFSFPEVNVVTYGLDDINDGIPRLSRTLSQKSRSTKSRQAAVAKVNKSTFYLQLYNLFLEVMEEFKMFSNEVPFESCFYENLFRDKLKKFMKTVSSFCIHKMTTNTIAFPYSFLFYFQKVFPMKLNQAYSYQEKIKPSIL